MSRLVMDLMWRMFYRSLLAYPQKHPLVYVCTVNRVTGVVRAEDFDSQVRQHRLECSRKDRLYNFKPYRPEIDPVYLFSDKKWGENNLLVGNEADLCVLTGVCPDEERSFHLPPIHNTGLSQKKLSFEEVFLKITGRKITLLETFNRLEQNRSVRLTLGPEMTQDTANFIKRLYGFSVNMEISDLHRLENISKWGTDRTITLRYGNRVTNWTSVVWPIEYAVAKAEIVDN